jgi:hypothetical protein
MRTYWENDGEPTDNGTYAATIDMEDGKTSIQKFYGSSHKEVADKLMAAQANATARINELRGDQKPDLTQPPAAFQPHELNADERFVVAQDLMNPATAPEAITKVVEAAMGASLDKVRDVLSEQQVEEYASAGQKAAFEFTQENPEYFICDYNRDTMVGYMKSQGMDPRSKKNYQIAYERLANSGLLIAKPATTPQPADGALPPQPASPEQPGVLPTPTVTTRPRGVVSSSGIRAGDSSSTPTPRKPAPKYTREQIDSMGSEEYKAKLQGEPGFREFVDSLNATPAR